MSSINRIDESINGIYQSQYTSLEDLVNKVLKQQEKQDIREKINEIRLKNLNDRVNQIEGRRIVSVMKSSGYALGKTTLKLGGKEIVFQMFKSFSVAMAKDASKNAAKLIPLAGFAIGIGGSLYRFRNGEYLKSSGEIIGGVACLVPGGSVISAILDIMMGGHDVYEVLKNSEHPLNVQSTSHTLTLQEAYRIFSIENDNPTREEVDRAYQQQCIDHHSDLFSHQDGMPSELDNSDGVASLLLSCKELIYKERGWE